MKAEEILQIVDSPFALLDELITLGYNGTDLEICKRIQFILYLRYLDAFFKKYGCPIVVPAIDGYFKDWMDTGYVNTQRFERWQADSQKNLFFQVMLYCNWCYGIKKSGEEVEPLLPEQVACTQKEWDAMKKRVSKVVISRENTFGKSEFVICWNFVLEWYFRFRIKNKKLIKALFFLEDEAICRLVEEIKNPLEGGPMESVSTHGNKRYILAFVFQDTVFGKNLSFCQLNYNFCIRIFVLDLLIKYALQIFEEGGA